MIQLLSEQEIMSRWIKTNINPLITVALITYNHETYIREAIESVLMQRINFPYEVIIHDDASTDNTQEIIMQYANQYPNIIKPILQKENLWLKKGISGTTTIVFPSAQGKYIAWLEGDDYWTDPLKLQKQVDFLEENEGYSICFHPVKVKDENSNQLLDDYITGNTTEETTTVCDLAKGNFIHTPSVVFRKNQKVFDTLASMGKMAAGDYPLHMLNARYGKIKKLPDNMAVYRVHDGGVWSNHPDFEKRLLSWLDVLDKLIKEFNNDKKIVGLLEKQYVEKTYYAYKRFLGVDKIKSDKIFCLALQKNSHSVLELLKKDFEMQLEELKAVRDTTSFKLGKRLLKPFKLIKLLFK